MAIRYTQAERAVYVDAFKSSNLSQTDFCKTQNISFKSFNNWLRLSKRSALQASSNSKYSGLCTTNPAPLNQPLISNGQAGATEKFKPRNDVAPKAHPHFIPVQLTSCAQTELDYCAQTSAPCEQEISPSIPIKIKGFLVELPLDLLAPKGAVGVKMLLDILHKLPLKHHL
ncbi:MAG: hypothetical protein Q8R43_01760 [Alphaproteobacteria bacterium]|nr:hypothetical protein [Alphaproteobacteria bacterium]